MTDAAPDWDTPCPMNAEDRLHCSHWYDDAAPCCYCNDDGGMLHGDHHPSLDCRTCSDRIANGRTTYAEVYVLAERRYQRTGHAWPNNPKENR